MEKSQDTISLEKIDSWGGRREGSGRRKKKKLAKQFQARQELYKWIDENWDALMNGLKIALSKQDKEMMKYLLDQRIGKAPVQVDQQIEGNFIISWDETDTNSIHSKDLG